MTVSLLLLWGIWDSISSFFGAMMQPLYWAVSGLLVGFHWVWTPVFGADSGWAWTLAIVSMTVLIRVLLIPLFVQQINSARNMQIIQPKVRALQEKYGHDRERVGKEIMNLYREEGVNPAASCLPLLLQMPIFIALFQVLSGAANGVAHGSWLANRPELMTSLQNATIFGAKLAGRFWPVSNFGGTQVLALVLILAMTAVLFVTQLQLMRRNMPPSALTGPMAQQQKMLLYVFPVIYMFTGVSIPIGVLIYWLTSNLWTLGQQYILIHNNPTPDTPAYVDWQERMRAKGLDPDEIERERRQKRRRTVKATTSATVTDEDGNTKATVARQQVTRQTKKTTGTSSAKPTTKSGSSAGASGRQQPKRQARSQRRTSAPSGDQANTEGDS